MEQEQILVSIVCNTYNHEKFIAQTLDSFLMQKTEFPFEILVHDDASTDATADIIREYEKKHPNLIRPIYQTENQYSKKVPISNAFQFPRARGKYIAFCEGDDYWTDPMKLQKQVDAMEQHPEIEICAHRADVMEGDSCVKQVPDQNTDTIFTAEQVIAGGGGFVATNTLLFRREVFEKEYQFHKILSLDYVWQILGSLQGGMLYLGDSMSVYRRMTAGSWTSRMQKNSEAMVLHIQKVERMLRALNEDTTGKYADVIEKKIRVNQLEQLLLQKKYKDTLCAEHRQAFAELGLRTKVKVMLLAYCPWVETLLIKMNR